MKYFFAAMPEIREKLSAPPGFMLMLDFDGTLAPFADDPRRAAMPAAVKKNLEKCSRAFPVAVISGRSLKDVRQKVGLRGIAYAGNHGLEWLADGKNRFAPHARRAVKQMSFAARKLRAVCRAYPGAMLEHKGLSLSVHYRGLSPARAPRFVKIIRSAINSLPGAGRLEVFEGKKIIEARPKVGWNKGKSALEFLRYFGKKTGRALVPVFAGDDITDEDAFRSLKMGITVKVGRGKKSHAHYYIKNPGETAAFLARLRKTSGKRK